MLTVKTAPYTGPYSSDATKFPHSGPTIEALKRMMVRLKRMTPPPGGMGELDGIWRADSKFDRAWRQWEADEELPANGTYGEQKWKEARAAKLPSGQHALDKYACSLIRADWEAQHVPDESDVRLAITKFCLLAEANEDNWHYRLVRPLDVSVDPSGSYIVSDCSMFCIQCLNFSARETGIAVPDPSKQGYTGYGNTDYYENDHPRVSAPFKVGDLAHYPGHVTICRRAGDAQSAIFTSHGTEAGPIPTQIYYRSDFLYVVRPPLK